VKLDRVGLVAFIVLEFVLPVIVAAVGVGENFQTEDAAGVVLDGGDEALGYVPHSNMLSN
jgi:hypothetical protein